MLGMPRTQYITLVCPQTVYRLASAWQIPMELLRGFRYSVMPITSLECHKRPYW